MKATKNENPVTTPTNDPAVKLEEEFTRDLTRQDIALRVGKYSAGIFVIACSLAFFCIQTLLGYVMTSAALAIARVSLVTSIVGILVYALYYLKLYWIKTKMMKNS